MARGSSQIGLLGKGNRLKRGLSESAIIGLTAADITHFMKAVCGQTSQYLRQEQMGSL